MTENLITPQMILDGLNETIGLSEERVQSEWRNLLNPLHWLKVLFLFIIRLPVTLIGAAGFTVDKFEDHMWPKLLNLVWTLALIGILILLGVKNDQVIDVVLKKIGLK